MTPCITSVKFGFATAVILLLGCGTASKEPRPSGDEKGGEAAPVLEVAADTLLDAGKVEVGTSPALPIELRCLLDAYGDHIRGIEEEDGGLTVVLSNGVRSPWDDGVEKSFEEKLASPDLEDQLSIPYPVDELTTPPERNDDPGRIRVDDLFKAVYGGDGKEVKGRLDGVSWLGDRGGRILKFNRANGAAEALGRVGETLSRLLDDSHLKYVIPSAGTFNWRKIAGTDRLSAHSYGIAIDLNVKHSDYWRWSLRGSVSPIYRNRIPYEIARVFEENGFVWGGKWYHFDTMHFEYRPELLDPRCVR